MAPHTSVTEMLKTHPCLTLAHSDQRLQCMRNLAAVGPDASSLALGIHEQCIQTG